LAEGGAVKVGPRYGGSKSFEFPGLRGRKLETFGYRYGGDLDGLARSHTLAAAELLEAALSLHGFYPQILLQSHTYLPFS
jgi:hypothetical protein